MSTANNNNNINNNKAVNNSYYTFEEGGRYFFGDYSPFDENKNFINVLNDFVSISTDIIKVHRTLKDYALC